jgi:hypothetical protein
MPTMSGRTSGSENETMASDIPISMGDGNGAGNSSGSDDGNADDGSGAIGAGKGETGGDDPDEGMNVGEQPTNGECEPSGTSADEVVWIGDSWIDIPGNQKARVNELARAAGVLESNESFVDLAVSGSPIGTIVNQYTNRQAGATKVRALLMDGGGINTIQGGGSQASVTNVVDAFTQHLEQVASDGTVEHIVYFLYPELPTIAGVAALRPGMQAACSASSVPCYFLDLQPLWEGHPEYTGGDQIHPSQAGANVIAEAIWAILEANCIAQ